MIYLIDIHPLATTGMPQMAAGTSALQVSASLFLVHFFSVCHSVHLAHGMDPQLQSCFLQLHRPWLFFGKRLQLFPSAQCTFHSRLKSPVVHEKFAIASSCNHLHPEKTPDYNWVLKRSNWVVMCEFGIQNLSVTLYSQKIVCVRQFVPSGMLLWLATLSSFVDFLVHMISTDFSQTIETNLIHFLLFHNIKVTIFSDSQNPHTVIYILKSS